MRVKIRNLYIFWVIYSLMNVFSKLVGLFNSPWVEIAAMSYGAFSFITIYYVLIRLGIIHEKQND